MVECLLVYPVGIVFSEKLLERFTSLPPTLIFCFSLQAELNFTLKKIFQFYAADLILLCLYHFCFSHNEKKLILI